MLAKDAISLSNEETGTINPALDEFERSLSSIERDSQDAFALAIFINSCFDRDSFQPNKLSALVYFQNARKSANILAELIEGSDTRLFQKGIQRAKTILRDSLLLNVDFFSTT